MIQFVRDFVKDPDEILDYVVDWRTAGCLEPGETILTSEWIVPDVPAGLVQGVPHAASHTDYVTTVWLSGGLLHNSYEVTNRVTTSGDRTYDRSITIRIEAR